MRLRRGFTLAEILVVSFIGLIVMGLCMEILLPSVWMFRVESARSEAQQASLLAVSRLQTAILNSQMESIYIGDNPVAVVLQEVVDTGQPFDSGTGAPVMGSRWRLYYFDRPGKRLMAKYWPPVPPGTPALRHDYPFGTSNQPIRLLYQQDLQTIVAHPNGTEQVIARNVEALYVTDYANDADNNLNLLSPPLEVSITCSVDTSMRGSITHEAFTAGTRVSPRSIRY